MTDNPFTITFGIEPSAPIKRIKEAEKITSDFRPTQSRVMPTLSRALEEAEKRFCFLTCQIIWLKAMTGLLLIQGQKIKS